MTDEDRTRWNERWAGAAKVQTPVGPPAAFAEQVELLPTEGRALDIACGRGESAVWLALRGLTVRGVDASDTAIDVAQTLAFQQGVAATCEFVAWDLDTGLPFGEKVDVVLCHMFRDRRLDAAIVERLVPGGLLAVAVRSEVGGEPGPYAAAPNELPEAFHDLEILWTHEGNGTAALLGRRSA